MIPTTLRPPAPTVYATQTYGAYYLRSLKRIDTLRWRRHGWLTEVSHRLVRAWARKHGWGEVLRERMTVEPAYNVEGNYYRLRIIVKVAA